MLLELRGKIHQGMANETNSQQDTRSTAAQRDQAKTRGRNNSSMSQPTQWGPESVDLSSCFPPLCLQFLRLHKLLWYLPAVLRQQYYASTLLLPPSTISWVGSIQILLVYFVGAFSGRALDAGHYRLILFAGVTLQVVGVFMTSLS